MGISQKFKEWVAPIDEDEILEVRSEERRVGKEC